MQHLAGPTNSDRFCRRHILSFSIYSTNSWLGMYGNFWICLLEFKAEDDLSTLVIFPKSSAIWR